MFVLQLVSSLSLSPSIHSNRCSIVSFLGSMAIVVSLAEIASIYPTAGGQYHWVAVLAPAKGRLISSWSTAWISIGGQVMLTASAALAGGLQLQGLITLNNLDTYVPQRWQGMLFYDLVLLYALIINVYGVKVLSSTNTVSGTSDRVLRRENDPMMMVSQLSLHILVSTIANISVTGVLHIVGFIAVTATLLALAEKRDAHFVFAETSNATGWPNNGVAWLIGLLSTTYSMLGYDAATHLSEELPSPRKNVPLAMVGSVLVNGILGLIYCIVLLYSLPDLDAVLTSPTGFPFMQVFLETTRSSAGATVMSLIPCLIAVAANAAGLTSTSRTFWSLARDNATPKATYFAHIDDKLHIPLRMIVLISGLEFLLGFIYLGNSTAFNAVLSMAILGMYLSYALPIIYMLLFGRKGNLHTPGPFKLGRYGPYLNVLALIWLLVAIFFSTWPNFYPVTAVNMNYSVVVLAGWVSFGAVYYVVSGRHIYIGPVIELDGVAAIVNKK